MLNMKYLYFPEGTNVVHELEVFPWTWNKQKLKSRLFKRGQIFFDLKKRVYISKCYMEEAGLKNIVSIDTRINSLEISDKKTANLRLKLEKDGGFRFAASHLPSNIKEGDYVGLTVSPGLITISK